MNQDSIWKLKEEDTLLDAFILKKIKEHVEPQRKGTPRGKVIGMKGAKYFGCLLSLKDNAPITQLAESLKVDPQLFSKWRTEDPFKEVNYDLALQFSGIVIDHLRKRAKRQSELIAEFMSLPFDEMTVTLVPVLSTKEFGDLFFYSDKLLLFIVEKLMYQINEWLRMDREDEKFQEQSLFIRQCDDMMRAIASKKWEYERLLSDRPKQEITERESIEVNKALTKDDMDERDRKIVICKYRILANQTRQVDYFREL